MLDELFARLERGDLKLLPHKVFAIDDVVSAFRHMAQAKHLGKVVITFAEHQQLDAVPVDDQSSYLVTGGLGGLGLKMAEWLVDRGAAHVVLTSRRTHPSDEALQTIQAMEGKGATITVLAGDVSREARRAAHPGQIAENLPPLARNHPCGGRPGRRRLRQQTWPNFERVMAPKVLGAWHLHQQTQSLPLEFFVCFSSVASLLGSPGQGNYAAANAFLDALAQHRTASGMPGLSIPWGPWDAVGMTADKTQRDRDRWSASGMGHPGRPGPGGLGPIAASVPPRVGVLPVVWPKFLKQAPKNESRTMLAEIAADVSPAGDERIAVHSVRASWAGSQPRQRPIARRWYRTTSWNWSPRCWESGSGATGSCPAAEVAGLRFADGDRVEEQDRSRLRDRLAARSVLRGCQRGQFGPRWSAVWSRWRARGRRGGRRPSRPHN
jgi:hypothetical protein